MPKWTKDIEKVFLKYFIVPDKWIPSASAYGK